MKYTQLTLAQTASLCRGFALLLRAGISTQESTRLLRLDDTATPDQVLVALEQDLDRGAPLSAAMEHTGAFPSYVYALTRVGEESGRLEEALNALAEYYEERQRTTQLVKNALSYPMLVFLAMLAVIGVLLIQVMPVFDRVYRNLGSRLTGLAGGMLRLGQALRASLPVLLVLLSLMTLLILAISLVPSFRDVVVSFFRKHFGDRGVLRSFNNAKFLRAFSMGLDSGLPLEDSLDLAEGLLTHTPAAARIARLRVQSSEGASLADALQAAGFLSSADGRLLTAGSRSGAEGSVLHQLARERMEKAEKELTQAISCVEPAMVLIAALLVGVILLSAMLPLMNILTSIG